MDEKEEMNAMIGELAEIRGKLTNLKNRANNTTFQDETRSISSTKSIPIECRRTLKGHLAKIVGIQWFSSVAGSVESIVSTAPDGKLLVWNPISSMKSASMNLSCLWTTCCSASSNGILLASGALDNTCSIHSLQNKQPEITCLKKHDAYVSQCRFVEGSNLSNKLLTSSGDHTCIEWDIESQKPINLFQGHIAEVLNMDVEEGENSFLTCSLDKSCKIWDRRTNKCQKTCEGHEKDINACKYFPNQRLFASVSDDRTCRLYDLRSDQYIASYNRSQITSAANSVCFSSSGRLLFVGYDDGKCRVWDTLKNSQIVATLPHGGRVSCVERNPKGDAVCTGSWDGILRIWN